MTMGSGMIMLSYTMLIIQVVFYKQQQQARKEAFVRKNASLMNRWLFLEHPSYVIDKQHSSKLLIH